VVVSFLHPPSCCGSVILRIGLGRVALISPPPSSDRAAAITLTDTARRACPCRRKEDILTTIKAFIKRHPVLTYYVLTFAIWWGGLLMLIGPGGFLGTTEPSEELLPFVYMAVLAGPSVAGILLTGLVSGRAGLREVLSRLLRWRAGARWYAVALLTAPLLMMATLFALWLTSPVFLPGIFASDDKASILLIGLVAGLAVGFFEELGWTGFAAPRLRLRYGVFATGLIVGLLWGAWHFPLFSGSDSGALPQALFLAGLLFSFLPAFRVLMVWVYDRTGSLLVAMLMHASLTASTLILQPLATGVPLLTYDLVLAAALWVVVAAVVWANGGHLSRQRLRRRMA
jgi:membrane protease YdiL (CAAX protease family)